MGGFHQLRLVLEILGAILEKIIVVIADIVAIGTYP